MEPQDNPKSETKRTGGDLPQSKSPTKSVRPGVYRFRSHEEADAWMEKFFGRYWGREGEARRQQPQKS
jgi:hypothetical protein